MRLVWHVYEISAVFCVKDWLSEESIVDIHGSDIDVVSTMLCTNRFLLQCWRQGGRANPDG